MLTSMVLKFNREESIAIGFHEKIISRANFKILQFCIDDQDRRYFKITVKDTEYDFMAFLNLMILSLVWSVQWLPMRNESRRRLKRGLENLMQQKAFP